MASGHSSRNSERWYPLELPKALFCILVAWSLTRGLLTDGAITDGVQAKTAHACEDGQLELECQVGELIRILRANYGRFTISVCNRQGQTEGWNLQCMSPKAKDIISERCDGRRECKMLVTNHAFGDPCPSTSKYAEVKYTCHIDQVENPPDHTTPPTEPPPVQIHIPLNGSPKPPQIVSATALSPSQIEVVWRQAEPSSPILTTAVYFKEAAKPGEPALLYTKYEISIILKDLRPKTVYTIFLKSFNVHGPSVSSRVVNVTTPALDDRFIKTITPRPDPAEEEFIEDLSEKVSLTTRRPYFGDNFNDATTTSVTTDQPTTLIPDLLWPDVDPSVNEHSFDGLDETADEKTDVDDDSMHGVVDKFCEGKLHRGIVWPHSRFGRIVQQNCPEGFRGIATWRCLDSGWERTGPDLTDCMSAWMEKIDVQIKMMMRGEVSADHTAVALNEAVAKKVLTPGDLKKSSIKLIPQLVKGLQRDDPTVSKPIRIHRVEQFMKAFLSTCSDLLSKDNIQAWRSLSQHDRRRAATSLILAIEQTGFQAAGLMTPGASEVIVEKNIIMEVRVVDTQQAHHDITFPAKDSLQKTAWEADTGSASLTITSTSLKVVGRTGPVNMVFTLFKNLEDLMQPPLNAIFSTPALFPSADEGQYSTGSIRDNQSAEAGVVRIVNTKIIAASINSTMPRRGLTEPLVYILRHHEPTSDTKPLCSYWDLNSSYLSGHWSQDGCRLLDSNATHTTCQCNHLTNFAVLMDVTGIKLSQENELALRVITFVGCVISVVCLTLSWITFLVFKNLQCDRNTIHRNLVLCLLLGEIVFLVGIAQTEPKIVCSVIAGILHYLFLGVFAWMCLEGVQLYIMLVEVFEQEKSRVHWYYLFGYGAPAVVVAVSAGVYHQGYGTTRHCWLTTEKYFIWSFVGPALLVMLINVFMLSIAIYTMCHHSAMSITTRDRSKVTKFRAWMKGAIILVVLLGLTWMLGVLYLNEESVVIAYFFSVLNSLQGLFIFVFHCLKNEKVQIEYRKVVRRSTWLPNCIRVNYGGFTGVTSSSHIGTSSSGNYLSKLFGPRKNSSSVPSTNNSAKPFLSSDQQRCETERSTCRESAIIPSSLNGYMYNPSCSSAGSTSAKTSPLQCRHSDSMRSRAADEEHSYERVDEQEVDYSNVDSGFVSVYCRHNMQCGRGDRRFSSGSEDSYNGGHLSPCYRMDTDNLSTLTLASSSRKPSSYISSSEILDRSLDSDLDNDLERKQRKKPSDHQLNLHQYVINASRKNINNNCDERNVDDTLKRGDNVSASMNKLSKPVHSLSSIPEAEASHDHASMPNLLARRNLTAPTLDPTPAAVYSVAQDAPEPVYEDIDRPSSTKTSLPHPALKEVPARRSKDKGSSSRTHRR